MYISYYSKKKKKKEDDDDGWNLAGIDNEKKYTMTYGSKKKYTTNVQ